MSDDKSPKIQISPVRVILLLLVIAAIYYLTPQFSEFNTTMGLLEHSSWIWVVIAIVMTGFTFLLSAVIQYAAGNSIGKISDLVRLGLAGSFLNHFLPFSVGGIGLTADYYRKLGQRGSEALVMATIPTAIGSITVILIALVISPITVVEFAHSLSVSYRPNPNIVVPIIIVCVILAAIAMFFYRKRLVEVIKEAILGLKSVRNFRQLAKVSGFSALLTLVAALALYASVEAIHSHLSLVAAVTIFIASLLVSEITPTPGGIGPTEAVLVIGLTGAGLTASQAVAATLIFRLISFLLPLLPGAVAVVQLNRPVQKA